MLKFYGNIALNVGYLCVAFVWAWFNGETSAQELNHAHGEQ